jgi:hypothetical protein
MVEGLADASTSGGTFSAFDDRHALLAERLIEQMTAAADKAPEPEAIDRGLEVACSYVGVLSEALLRFAVRGFLADRRALTARAAFDEVVRPSPMATLREPDTREDALMRWRERLNFHHDDWHNVYRWRNRWTSGHPQGEHFLHMHQQMLAYYDAERLSLGLGRIAPWTLTEVIPYRHESLPRSGGRTREAGKLIDSDARADVIEDVKTRRLLRDNFDVPPWFTEAGDGTKDPVQENSEHNGGATKLSEFRSAHALGATIENPYHNVGHMLVASLTSSMPGDYDDMGDTFCSHRDAVFWGWHKHIDDLSTRWQELQHASAPEETPALVRQRLTPTDPAHDSPDIVFRVSDPEGLGQLTDPKFELGELAPERWSLRLMSDEALLCGRGFSFYYRVESQSDEAQSLTGKLFLVPQDYRSDRRAWINLDSFNVQLGPHERQVIARSAGDFSVLYHGREDGLQYGWPPEILLPAPGDYTALLLLCPANLGGHGGHEHGGHGEVKDMRLGYPFDRTWPESVEATLAKANYAATLNVRLRLP